MRSVGRQLCHCPCTPFSVGNEVGGVREVYQLFAIPQNPDNRAAYGRHDRGHWDRGETLLGWVFESKSDGNMMLSGRCCLNVPLDITPK